MTKPQRVMINHGGNAQMSNGFIDIAVNLSSSKFKDKQDEIVARAQAADVSAMIALGCSLDGSEQALALAQRFPNVVYATAGIHPHDASSFSEQSIADLRQLAQQPEVVAIGECGLDYNRDFSPRPQQRLAFEAQLQLAVELGMPVVMHQRDAHDDFIEIVSRYRHLLKDMVLHCFTGTKAELIDCIALDLHIGITGWICDERRGLELKEIVALIPDHRLMIETDAPFLLPRNLKQKPKPKYNEPAYLPHIAAEIAQARQQPLTTLSTNCLATTQKFFKLNR